MSPSPKNKPQTYMNSMSSSRSPLVFPTTSNAFPQSLEESMHLTSSYMGSAQQDVSRLHNLSLGSSSRFYPKPRESEVSGSGSQRMKITPPRQFVAHPLHSPRRISPRSKAGSEQLDDNDPARREDLSAAEYAVYYASPFRAQFHAPAAATSASIPTSGLSSHARIRGIPESDSLQNVFETPRTSRQRARPRESTSLLKMEKHALLQKAYAPHLVPKQTEERRSSTGTSGGGGGSSRGSGVFGLPPAGSLSARSARDTCRMSKSGKDRKGGKTITGNAEEALWLDEFVDEEKALPNWALEWNAKPSTIDAMNDQLRLGLLSGGVTRDPVPSPRIISPGTGTPKTPRRGERVFSVAGTPHFGHP
eukprot:ANDGO_01605.mRNA.1 hypothetical protein